MYSNLKKGKAKISYLLKAAFGLPTENIPISIAPVISANESHETLH
ncbi:MAG: hypothetical protein WCE25_05755 [Nitrososphaeraceae archaeon]